MLPYLVTVSGHFWSKLMPKLTNFHSVDRYFHSQKCCFHWKKMKRKYYDSMYLVHARPFILVLADVNSFRVRMDTWSGHSFESDLLPPSLSLVVISSPTHSCSPPPPSCCLPFSIHKDLCPFLSHYRDGLKPTDTVLKQLKVSGLGPSIPQLLLVQWQGMNTHFWSSVLATWVWQELDIFWMFDSRPE